MKPPKEIEMKPPKEIEMLYEKIAYIDKLLKLYNENFNCPTDKTIYLKDYKRRLVDNLVTLEYHRLAETDVKGEW